MKTYEVPVIINNQNQIYQYEQSHNNRKDEALALAWHGAGSLHGRT
jgi:hypothetical protein